MDSNTKNNKPIDLSEIMARLQTLEAENEQLRARPVGRAAGVNACKVSSKGGVSVYGLGRFPVTLYASQWAALFGAKPKIEAFIAEHAGELASKD